MEISEKNLAKLQRLFNLMDDDALTKEQFTQAFESVLKKVVEIEKRNIEEIDRMNKTISAIMDKLQSDTSENVEGLKAEVKKLVEVEHLRLKENYTQKMLEVDDRMSEVKDGKDADEERILENLKAQIHLPSIEELKDDLPVMGTQVRDALELLQGEERLDISSIKGLEKGEGNTIKYVGGTRGVYMYIDGKKYGLMNRFNLVPGTGVSLTFTKANGRNDITINASSTALTVLTATGTIDDSNKTFTFASEPTLVVVNGTTYRHGKGCSISSTTVTLDNPVGTGGDIYGL